MITKVTITGADDSIQPAELLMLATEFPFVEWGILCSRNQTGMPRFPSRTWLDVLTHFQHSLSSTDQRLNLSCHLCGSYVREFLLGGRAFVAEITESTWSIFDRVQLNTHGYPHKFSSLGLNELKRDFPDKQFIFQYDNANSGLFDGIRSSGLNYAALFDLSHGAGLWPDLLPGVPCGYAGGLSPDNLQEQIERIEKKAGTASIWIDAETHVRVNEKFDYHKVREFLKIARPYALQLV